MCWSEGASIAMVAAGAGAMVLTLHQGRTPAIWLTFGYFTVMEGLQALGYGVVDACGTPANETITLLSYWHIAFQPFFINAFAMELLPHDVKRRVRFPVYLVCAASAVVMLLQLHPLAWAGTCRPGTPLCGEVLCLVSGQWHIAWDIPYNGLLVPLETTLGTSFAFPTYILAAFALPLVYGAWRFVVFHALVGPILAGQLTANPNEAPAVWCLFSIFILAVGLSPWLWRRFTVHHWWAWPRTWRPA
jgi:hypothetical protein